ncbi:MAG: hypothetical protein AAGC79_06155 [Pseudomonadota bacterium]
MRNIKTFNIFAADILATTLKSFPSPASVCINDTIGRTRDFLEPLYPEGFEKSDLTWVVWDKAKEQEYLVDLTQTWDDTAVWLRNAGYISFDDKDLFGGYIPSIGLTEKGLKVLNTRLDALETSRSIGERLSDAAIWAGGATTGAMIQSLIEQIIGEGAKVLL